MVLPSQHHLEYLKTSGEILIELGCAHNWEMPRPAKTLRSGEDNVMKLRASLFSFLFF